ncbi:PREDICTED: complement component C1q receptor-like [Branchiostoma belcheri]|uniref:Complement component C1q receptor-like n=1 Tax=Branchiostoma belcheri TaxID=7741 RepID=A0A6P4YIL2_BRABE|nr:PREDICTED: complement component C1q receptor-like [Branchiostoma belcheri]
MKRGGPCAIYCVALLVAVAVDNTLALTGPTGSVCGSQCCDGWDQVGDTCVHCYYPCVHGTCVDTNVCECEPGWEGHDCSQDVDECWYETHACHHNCHNNDGCYTCSCDDGFHLINSTHCVSSPTSDISSTPVVPPQGATEIPAHCVTATTTQTTQRTTRTTTTASMTTRRLLRTDRTTSPGGSPGRQNVDWRIWATVSGWALVLLVIFSIFIYCKKKKKTTPAEAGRQQRFANTGAPGQPGYSHMPWRNPTYDNIYVEEIREAPSPPPPYAATEGYRATAGFAVVAGMPEVDITHKDDVGVGKAGISFPGTISAFPTNLDVDIQKEPPVQDDAYKTLNMAPGNDWESSKRC